MPKKISLDNCKKCGNAIAISCLEASLCSSECGWIREKSEIQLEVDTS